MMGAIDWKLLEYFSLWIESKGLIDQKADVTYISSTGEKNHPPAHILLDYTARESIYNEYTVIYVEAAAKSVFCTEFLII